MSERSNISRPRSEGDNDRKYIIDRRASLHMTGRTPLTLEDKKTARTTDTTCIIMTTSGLVEAKEERTVYINNLDIFLGGKMVEDSPAVLSLGMLCEEMCYPYACKAREQPLLTKHAVSIECRSDNLAPVRCDQTKSDPGAF